MKRILGLVIVLLASKSMAATMEIHDVMQFRTANKMALGLMVGGSSAGTALHAELNFEDENAAVAEIGMSAIARSYGAAWKHSLPGKFLNPYFTAGFSHWSISPGGKDSVNESGILTQVLSAEEKTKSFATASFITGSIGVQYQELDGEFAGASLFGSIDLLVEPFRKAIAPTGSVGVTYFF